MRNITSNGLQLIKRFEGFSSAIYSDSAGLPTIGCGHLLKSYEVAAFKAGITKAKAEELLKQDVTVAESAVIRLINVPLTNDQFDALVSFTFNVGAGALQRSTLRARLNREEYWLAPEEMMKWIYANGKKVQGLILRRMAEVELYSLGQPSFK